MRKRQKAAEHQSSQKRAFAGQCTGTMKSGRMGFLEKNAADPVVASAILTAPAFLSGLTDAEAALVKHKIEQL